MLATIQSSRFYTQSNRRQPQPGRGQSNRRILMILGHPQQDSFCGALAEAYAEAARETGAEVRQMYLGNINFDPILRHGYRSSQELEPDLVQAQESILWAERLVFVYPNWWGTMPALLKGFIDRVFLPGFAFKYHRDDPFWDRLLVGRSAHLIVTMDTPPWYYRWVFGRPGHNQMKRTILEFCGIKPVQITEIGPVRKSSPQQRQKWIARVGQLAAQV